MVLNFRHEVAVCAWAPRERRGGVEPRTGSKVGGMPVSRVYSADAWRTIWPALALVAVGALGFVGVLDWVVEQERLAVIDQPLVEFLARHRTPGMTAAMTLVTSIFGPVVLPVLVGAGCLVWWRVSGSWWRPAVLAGAMVGATLLGVVLKRVVGRDRPSDVWMAIPGYETSASFPSGHTIGVTTLVLVGSYLVWHGDRPGLRRPRWAVAAWCAGAAIIVALVAFTRLYLGYHFLTDVLAGACVGVIALGVVVGMVRWRDLRARRG